MFPSTLSYPIPVIQAAMHLSSPAKPETERDKLVSFSLTDETALAFD